ncbi:MAG: Rdx family protein [Cyanobacteria bacterium]|nr:Rdx family protein [Cyanobacteriota bacterium]
MAAILESELEESTELVKSQGGVFEVEDRGELIFSKRKARRFPEEAEILAIIRAVEAGKTLDQAQLEAGQNVRTPISFMDWLANLVRGR